MPPQRKGDRGSPPTEIHGELQTQLMAVVWRLGDATVEQVRSNLPSRYRSAYTTVQTVLNRLAERGLLKRTRQGNAIVYSPRLTEAEYVRRSIESTLAGASSEARQAALAQLVGSLDGAQIAELRKLARRSAAQRKGRAQ
jgi:predicted transcriptional regulator